MVTERGHRRTRGWFSLHNEEDPVLKYSLVRSVLLRDRVSATSGNKLVSPSQSKADVGQVVVVLYSDIIESICFVY